MARATLFSVLFLLLLTMGVCNSLAATRAKVTGGAVQATRRMHFNSADKWSGLNIQKIVDVSPNTKRFVIGLPSAEHDLGSHVSSFVLVKRLGADNQPVSRPYTPITQPETAGQFELLVKKYENGALSAYLHELKEGDEIEVKGPMKKLEYVANMKKHIGMIAGGTGITPMLQVIKRILDTPEDKTEVSLLFANRHIQDILLKQEIDELARTHDNFHVHYMLSQPPAEGSADAFAGMLSGHVDQQCISLTVPKPDKDTLVYVCGPPGFMQAVSGNKTPDKAQGEVSGAMKALGYTEDMVFKF